jgi:hypothetical protein
MPSPAAKLADAITPSVEKKFCPVTGELLAVR